jgi:hypothetical protein
MGLETPGNDAALRTNSERLWTISAHTGARPAALGLLTFLLASLTVCRPTGKKIRKFATLSAFSIIPPPFP